MRGGTCTDFFILCVATIIPGINQWNKKFFTALFTIFALCMITFCIDLVTYEDPSMALAEKINIYLEYLIFSFSMPLFTVYLLHTCNEDWRKSLLFRAVIILWFIFFILLEIAQFTTFIYYITPDNKYIRGSWYLLLIAPMFAVMFINLAGVIKRRAKLPKKYFIAFLIHLISLQISLFFQNVIVENLIIIVLGLCISTLSMFAIILYDQIKQYLKQQREIANQQANILILQMRPHFIYNAMMSIYYLCAKDHQKAQQVTMDFTTYLRKNFTAIASENTIPFSDELQHTEAYLSIEQVSFEDSLFVEYDTPHKEFYLPPLTLQPIVENAVKHGMDPEYAPLRIYIKTRKTDFGSEIIIEDNGPGFLPANNDSKLHIALANIQQRLEMMCGGTLKILPREGGGTVVIVFIP